MPFDNQDFSYANYCATCLTQSQQTVQSPLHRKVKEYNLRVIERKQIEFADTFRNFFLTEPIKRNIVFEGILQGGFFDLSYVWKRNTNPNNDLMCGWKFHIGVSDEDVPKAWDIVKDVLIKHKIRASKVVIPGQNFSTNHDQRQYAKQITIHQFRDERSNQVEFWKELLEEIETRFRAENIRPDPNKHLSADTPISGSIYCSYRSDKKISDNKRGYVYIIKYFHQIPLENRNNYGIFNKLTNINNMRQEWLPLAEKEVEEIIMDLSRDSFVSSENLAKLLSKQQQFNHVQQRLFKELEDAIAAKAQEINAREEIIRNEVNANLLFVNQPYKVALNEIARRIKADETIIAIKEEFHQLCIGRVERIRETLSLEDKEILDTKEHLYQKLNTLDANNRIVFYLKQLCEEPQVGYGYSAINNESNLPNPFETMQLQPRHITEFEEKTLFQQVCGWCLSDPSAAIQNTSIVVNSDQPSASQTPIHEESGFTTPAKTSSTLGINTALSVSDEINSSSPYSPLSTAAGTEQQNISPDIPSNNQSLETETSFVSDEQQISPVRRNIREAFRGVAQSPESSTQSSVTLNIPGGIDG